MKQELNYIRCGDYYICLLYTSCGAVTAAVRYYSEPRVLFPVSRGSFYPAPNVDSMVCLLYTSMEPPPKSPSSITIAIMK